MESGNARGCIYLLFTCLLGEVFVDPSEGHLSETDGDLTTRGWGRSDSDMAGEILDCMGAISAAPVPVIGPHRGSEIAEKILLDRLQGKKCQRNY